MEQRRCAGGKHDPFLKRQVSPGGMCALVEPVSRGRAGIVDVKIGETINVEEGRTGGVVLDGSRNLDGEVGRDLAEFLGQGVLAIGGGALDSQRKRIGSVGLCY